MPYVERKLGQVVGKYAQKQAGYAEEWLDDAHPDLAKSAEIVAFETEQESQKQLCTEAKSLAMFSALKNATLAQIDNWVDTNFSGMTAKQRDFMKMVAAGVSLYLRER